MSGEDPATDEGPPPENDSGSTPENDSGSTPENDSGSTPENDSEPAPEDDPGSTPETGADPEPTPEPEPGPDAQRFPQPEQSGQRPPDRAETAHHRNTVPEILARPSVQEEVVAAVVLFALVGVGIGLVSVLVSTRADTAGPVGRIMGSIVVSGALGVAVFAVPVLATLAGLGLVDRMDADRRTVLLTGFVATSLGTLAMLTAAVALVSLAAGNANAPGGPGAGGFGIANFAVPVVFLSVTGGFVAVAAVVLRRRDRRR